MESDSSEESCWQLDTNQVPQDTRVVLGRETSPIPSQIVSKIPREILDKFESQSREVGLYLASTKITVQYLRT